MKNLLAVCLLLVATAAHAQLCNPACANQPAQCCNVPQADTFAAFESDAHDQPGNPFRLLAPADQAADPTCTTDSTITNLLVTIPQPNAQFETVDAPAFGNLVFLIKLKLQFAEITGQDAGTDVQDACFKLDTQGLVHVPSPITVTTGCGTEMFTIGQPRYACVLGPPIGKTLVCFAAKRLGPATPLPPGTDRLEDVCTLVDVL